MEATENKSNHEVSEDLTTDEEQLLFKMNKIIAQLIEMNKGLVNTPDELSQVGYSLINTFPKEVAKKLFVKISSIEGDDYNYALSVKQFKDCFENLDANIPFEKITQLAHHKGCLIGYDAFWFKNDDGKIGIDEMAFIDFLYANGFCTYVYEDNYIIIRVQNQIIESVNIFSIKQFVFDFIKYSLPPTLKDRVTPRDLMSKILALKHSLFNKSTMEFLPAAKLKIHRDTEDKSYIYYQNGVAEIGENEVQLISYQSLDGSIWKKQILNRDFEVCNNFEDSCFFQFIKNVCDNCDDRIQSLLSVIGYLVHRHKDPTQERAIIFSDEKISENGEANGGTGKSLIGEAISNVRNVIKLDGKNYKLNNFLFQQVTFETDIVQFDDVKSDFNLELLYSAITTGINVERKGETPYTIPFELSPKFEINTNYTIRGTGGNTEERRKFVVEFSDYYGPEKKPNEEFGHRFFKDWDKGEWMKFDNLIVHCIQLFLKNGLIPYAHRTLNLRNLISRTSEDFVEFMKSTALDSEHDLQELYYEFLRKNPFYKTLSHRMFCKWIKIFIDVYGLKTSAMISNAGYFRKGNSKQFIKIVEGLPLSDENTK